MEQMLNYIQEATKYLDVLTQKRNDGGYIVVPYKLTHLTYRKNVFTYWPGKSSISLIILGPGYLPKRKPFRTVDEMKNYHIAEMIVSKYNEIMALK